MAKYIRADGKNKPRFNLSGYDAKTLVRLRSFPHLMQTAQNRSDWMVGISGDFYLSPMERLLGINIMHHLNLNTQRCYPPQELLAARIGVSKRSIIRMTQQIEDAGWFGVTRHRNVPHGGRGKLANTYYPLVPQALRNFTVTSVTSRVQGDIIEVQGDIIEVHSDTQVSPQLGIYNRESTTFRTSYGVAGGNAILEDQKGALQEKEEQAKPIAKPYTSKDVELVQQVLNGTETTYAGIIDASRQPGAMGDGIGIDPPKLRSILNDCMRARLIGTERRNGKDYFWMTEHACTVPDWMAMLWRAAPHE